MSLVNILQNMRLNLLLKQFNIKIKADEKVYPIISFYFEQYGEKNYIRLYNKTINQAKEKAKVYGWKELKWYKPSTWSNGYYV